MYNYLDLLYSTIDISQLILVFILDILVIAYIIYLKY